MRRLIFAAVVLLIAAGAAAAGVLPSDPFDVPLRLHVAYGAIALFGGVVRWHAKHRAGSIRARGQQLLVGDMITSAFAGLLAFLACVRSGLGVAETGLLVGLAGLMGARALAWLERRVDQLLTRVGMGLPPSASMPLDDPIEPSPPSSSPRGAAASDPPRKD